MEPKLPTPEFKPMESVPPSPEISHNGPEALPPLGEVSSAEGVEVRATQAPVALPTPVAIPVIPAPASSGSQAVSDSGSGNPLVAGDDDLIEKEWVDRSKKVIADTRDDPYKREREVSMLKADYLKKRYGKSLGAQEE